MYIYTNAYFCSCTLAPPGGSPSFLVETRGPCGRDGAPRPPAGSTFPHAASRPPGTASGSVRDPCNILAPPGGTAPPFWLKQGAPAGVTALRARSQSRPPRMLLNASRRPSGNVRDPCKILAERLQKIRLVEIN
jgi:hypothetical protein